MSEYISGNEEQNDQGVERLNELMRYMYELSHDPKDVQAFLSDPGDWRDDYQRLYAYASNDQEVRDFLAAFLDAATEGELGTVVAELSEKSSREIINDLYTNPLIRVALRNRKYGLLYKADIVGYLKDAYSRESDEGSIQLVSEIVNQALAVNNTLPEGDGVLRDGEEAVMFETKSLESNPDKTIYDNRITEIQKMSWDQVYQLSNEILLRMRQRAQIPEKENDQAYDIYVESYREAIEALSKSFDVFGKLASGSNLKIDNVDSYFMLIDHVLNTVVNLNDEEPELGYALHRMQQLVREHMQKLGITQLQNTSGQVFDSNTMIADPLIFESTSNPRLDHKYAYTFDNGHGYLLNGRVIRKAQVVIYKYQTSVDLRDSE